MDAEDYDSPIGWLRLEADSSGLRSIHFPSAAHEGAGDKFTPLEQGVENPHLKDARRDLDRYFSRGESQTFSTKLAPLGTGFQKRVWDELRKIPFGSSATYGQIAERMGNPKASRAVGGANNRNPIPILLPCHRVVGAGGTLVGYAGELWRKEWLLKHEGALF